MEESLKYLLEAEHRAQTLVDKAIVERDKLLDQALSDIRVAEQRFKARIPGIQESFVNKAHQRADQTNAETLRRYVDRLEKLEREVREREERALKEAMKLLLDHASE